METKKWDLKSIKEGLDRFLSEFGRLPTVMEVDSLDYLPNRKYIERNFGGIQKIRELLGYKDIHLGKGKFRTEIALKVNRRGRDAELELQTLLQDKFGEVFVHTEKIFDNSKNRVDFYVYSPSENFGIDIFTTNTMHNLQGNINIKSGKYDNFKEKLYFVVAGDAFSQEDLDRYMNSKRKVMNQMARIVTISTLVKIIEPMGVYPNPLQPQN